MLDTVIGFFTGGGDIWGILGIVVAAFAGVFALLKKGEQSGKRKRNMELYEAHAKAVEKGRKAADEEVKATRDLSPDELVDRMLSRHGRDS